MRTIWNFTWRVFILEMRSCKRRIIKKRWFVQLTSVISLSVLNSLARFWGFRCSWIELRIMKVDPIIEMGESQDLVIRWIHIGMRWCRNIVQKPSWAFSRNVIGLSLIALTTMKLIIQKQSLRHSTSSAKSIVKSLRLVQLIMLRWRHMMKVGTWVFTRWFTIFMTKIIRRP